MLNKVTFLSHIRIFRHYIPSPFLLLGAIELCLLFGSALAGNAVRFQYWESDVICDSTLFASATLFALVLLASTSAMGVYSTAYREGTGAMMVRTVVSYCLLGCATLTVIYYFAPYLVMGRGVLVYSIFFSLFTVLPMRWLFFRLVDNDQLSSRAVVLGAGKRALQLEQRVAKSHKGVAEICTYICTSDNDEVLVSGKVCKHYASLEQIARDCNATEIVVALDDRRERDGFNFPLDELLESKLRGLNVVEAVTFYERELGILELSELRLGWMVFASGFTHSVFWDLVKRATDIAISLVILLLAWPLMLVGIVGIMLETGRPIIYKQARVGLNSQPFKIYKFRSMRTDAEIAGKAIWADANDNRVTRVGGFLRNTRIDELPQLYNVLKGDMSIVGPRPERPEFVEGLNKDVAFYQERHRVKPGLMGWAQLNYPYGASVEDSAQKLRYDLYYVKNRSLLLDLIIMVQTVQVILLGTGVR